MFTTNLDIEKTHSRQYSTVRIQEAQQQKFLERSGIEHINLLKQLNAILKINPPRAHQQFYIGTALE